jgi:putative endonuclease
LFDDPAQQLNPVVMGPGLRRDDEMISAARNRNNSMNTTPRTYYVYILASRRHGTLYIGVCNDLSNRLTLHRTGRGAEFVKKYGMTRLVYMETYASPTEAIAREKQLKNWHRDWKIRLIEEDNPDWTDLSHLL